MLIVPLPPTIDVKHQISVFDDKKSGSARIGGWAEKDEHCHLMGERSDKAFAPHVPRRHTRGFDVNAHRRSVALANQHSAPPRIKSGVEAAFLKFAKHEAFAREPEGNTGLSPRPNDSAGDLAHRLTCAKQERGKTKSTQQASDLSSGELGLLSGYCGAGAGVAGWPVRRWWRL